MAVVQINLQIVFVISKILKFARLSFVFNFRQSNSFSSLTIPIFDIPIFDIPIFDIPIFDIPIFDIPIFDIPIFDIPIFDIPIV